MMIAAKDAVDPLQQEEQAIGRVGGWLPANPCGTARSGLLRLKLLYQAGPEARPSPHVLREVRKSFGHAKSTAEITVLLLHDAWREAAKEPDRRKWTRKRRADDAWLRQQLGSLETPQ